MEEMTFEDAAAYRTICMAVGHLFTAFASFESTMSATLKMHLALKIESDPESPVGLALASAIYGSQRFTASKDAMKRIMSAEEAPKNVKERLAEIFSQVGEIERLRNGIAHKPIFPLRGTNSEKWAYTDLFSTKDTSKVETFCFEIHSLGYAASDLGLAALSINDMRGSFALFDPEKIPSGPIPWQYTPSMLSRLNTENQTIPQ